MTQNFIEICQAISAPSQVEENCRQTLHIHYAQQVRD